MTAKGNTSTVYIRKQTAPQQPSGYGAPGSGHGAPGSGYGAPGSGYGLQPTPSGYPAPSGYGGAAMGGAAIGGAAAYGAYGGSAPAPPPPPPPAPAAPASNWTKYDHNGRPYWHNALTGATTWDNPEPAGPASSGFGGGAPQSYGQNRNPGTQPSTLVRTPSQQRRLGGGGGHGGAGGAARGTGDNPEARIYAGDVFDNVDVDRSGYLDQGEFNLVLTNLGFAGGQGDRSAVYYALAGSNGQINRRDFVDYWVANHNI